MAFLRNAHRVPWGFSYNSEHHMGSRYSLGETGSMGLPDPRELQLRTELGSGRKLGSSPFISPAPVLCSTLSSGDCC